MVLELISKKDGSPVSPVNGFGKIYRHLIWILQKYISS